MKPKLYLITGLLGTLFLLSCKTAKKMYEKGNYDEAVELAAKKLQKDPDDPKLRSIITEAYRFAEADHQATIRSFAESSNELKWEWIYNEYAALQKMYDAIYRVPEIYRLLAPADHSESLATYAERAGQVRFDRGIYFMEQGDKASYKKAYRELDAALKFRPGHRDILLLRDEAYEMAVTNVIIHPLLHYGGPVFSSYNPGGFDLDDQLVRQLQFGSGNEFTRFFSSWDARAQQVRPDLQIELSLSRLDIGRPREIRNTRRVTNRVLVKETVYRPDSIIREYANVSADIISTRRTIQSEALLDISVFSESGGLIWNERIPASRSWSTETVHFTGDERALSSEDRQRVKAVGDPPPHERDITRALLDEVAGNAVYRVRNFIRARVASE